MYEKKLDHTGSAMCLPHHRVALLFDFKPVSFWEVSVCSILKCFYVFFVTLLHGQVLLQSHLVWL